MKSLRNSSFLQRKASRRAVLTGAAVAGVGAGALLLTRGKVDDAGGGTATNRGAPQAGESLEALRERYHGKYLRNLPGQSSGPRSGGTYRDWGFLPASWDLTGLGASTLAAYAFFHNSLISFQIGDYADNPNLWKTEPCLCEKWEWAGPTSLVMHLAQGVKWHDRAPVNGRAFNAEDVVYSINAYRKAPVQSSIYRDLERAEATDASTVRLTFRAPPAYFERGQTQPVNLMFAREQAESRDGLAKEPIGTGPFTLKEGKDKIGFGIARNPQYWRKDPRTGRQLPYLDAVEFNYFADDQSILAAFRSKQLEAYAPRGKEDWQAVLKTNPDAVSQITTPPASFLPHFEFRLDKAPWNDERVRRALSLAINRDAMIEGMASGLAGYGYGLDQSSFDQEWPWRADQLGEYSKFNVKQAKDLMDAAGLGNGLGRKAKLLMALDIQPLNKDIWTLVADAWRRNIGLETEIDAPADMTAWQAQFFTGSFEEIIGVGFLGPGSDMDVFTYEPMNSKSLRNYSHINDSTLDDLTERQGHEMDLGKRQALVRQIMARDLDQAYRIWTIAPYKINVRQPYVFNVADTVLAWSGAGWGSKGRELVWLSDH